MKAFRTLMIIALLGFLFSSCEYEWIYPEKPPVVTDTVSFSRDVIPISNNGFNTGVCHGAGATPPDLTEANAYNSLMNGGYVDTVTPEASIIYTCLLPGGSMNNYVKNAEDPNTILGWIQQGAENN